jgi:hypothetical protein
VNKRVSSFEQYVLTFNTQATISHAEQLNLPLNMHFTEPGQPFFIEIETDDVEDPDGEGRGLFETFFAVATTQVDDEDDDDEPTTIKEKRTRPRVEVASTADRRPTKKRTSAQVVIKPTDAPSVTTSQHTLRRTSQVAVANISNDTQRTQASRTQTQYRSQHSDATARGERRSKTKSTTEPLFIPASQPELTQREQQVLQESGWGDGNIAYEDFEALMGDDGEEVDFDVSRNGGGGRSESVNVKFGQRKELELPSDGEPSDDSHKENDESGREEIPATQITMASVCPFSTSLTCSLTWSILELPPSF